MALKVPVARPDAVPLGGPVSASQRIAAPAEAFGGGQALAGFRTGEALGKAAQNIGAEVVNYAALSREEEDKAVVNERLAQAKNYLNSVLYDPESGLLTKQNRDAMGSGKTFAERVREARKQYMNGLTERQRKLFETQFRTAEAAGVRTVSIHEANQRRLYLNQSAKAAIASDFRDAMANPFDPEARDAFFGDAMRKIDELAKQNGWDDKIKKAERERMLGVYYDGVFARMVDMNPAAARAYFNRERKRGLIPGDKIGKIKEMLDKGDLLAFGQRWVDEIFAKHPDDPQARYEALKSIRDPKQRREAERRLDEETARKERVKKQVRDAALEQAKQYLDQGRPVPIALELQLDPEDRKRLEDYKAFQINGPEPVTVREVLDKVSLLTDNQLKQMSAADLELQLRPYLDDQDWKSVVSRWRVAQGNGNKSDYTVKEVDDLLTFAMVDQKFIPDPQVTKMSEWDDQQLRNWRAVRKAVNDRIDTLERRGVAIGRKEIEQVIDDVLRNTVKKKSGFFGEETIPAVAVGRDEQGDVFVDVQVGPPKRVRRLDRTSELVPRIERINLKEAGADLPAIEAMVTEGGGVMTPQRKGQAIYIKKWLEQNERRLPDLIGKTAYKSFLEDGKFTVRSFMDYVKARADAERKRLIAEGASPSEYPPIQWNLDMYLMALDQLQKKRVNDGGE